VVGIRARSLTQRAALSFVSSALQQGARLVVGFALTPVIVGGLGAELFGAWGLIVRIAGFLGTGTLTPLESVRILVGRASSNPDSARKRRVLGAALLQAALLAPVVLAIGAILVVFTDAVIKVEQAHLAAVRVALAVSVVGVCLRQYLALSQSVLLAENLAYRRMGATAAFVLLGGGLNALGVVLGFGIPSLAVTTLAASIVLGLFQWHIVLREVPWIGVSMPSRKDFTESFRINAANSLAVVAAQIVASADALVVGLLLGPAPVATYLATGALARFAVEPVSHFYKNSLSPGVNALAGDDQWERVKRLRIEVVELLAYLHGVVGAVVLLFNGTFVRLWLGEDLFGGTLLGLAIIVGLTFRTLAACDGFLLEAGLHLRARTMALLLWGLISICLGLLGSVGHLWGVASGFALGGVGLWWHYQVLLARFRGIALRVTVTRPWRAASFAVAATAGGAALSRRVDQTALGWSGLILLTAGVAVGLLACGYFIALRRETRASLRRRARNALRRS